MEPLLPLATALVLGSVHALEADHLAAVSSFAVRRPRARDAFGFGACWALGHGGAVVAIGTILLGLGLHPPSTMEVWLERLVGATLVALGGWTALGMRPLDVHPHARTEDSSAVHLRRHLLRRDHDRRHAVTAVGALHGLAGTTPAVALIPMTRFDSPWLGAGYLVLFALGTALTMALYATLAGWVARRAALRSAALARGLAFLTGGATAGIGVHWLLG